MVAARMRPLLRSLPVNVGLAAVVVLAGGIGFVPLFEGPGYESALGAGLILPFAVAIAAALDVSAGAPRPAVALGRGLAIGGAFATAAWLTTIVHGLRAGFCDAASGM